MTQLEIWLIQHIGRLATFVILTMFRATVIPCSVYGAYCIGRVAVPYIVREDGTYWASGLLIPMQMIVGLILVMLIAALIACGWMLLKWQWQSFSNRYPKQKD